MRTLIIGDIHGCLYEFEDLLEKMNFKEGNDRLILLGDLINKGPYPLEVLKKARELQCEVVLGNHEWSFLQQAYGKRQENREFRNLLKDMKEEFSSWVGWIENFPLFIEDEDFIVVHGGIVPSFELSQTPAHLITRIRTWDGLGRDLSCESNPAWYDLYTGEKLVVFGHWAKRGLNVQKNVIGLDSGCVYGNKLSGLALPERKIYQVSARETYKEI